MDTKLRGALRQFTTETIFSPELPEAPYEELWADKAITEDGLTDQDSDEMICIWAGGIPILFHREMRGGMSPRRPCGWGVSTSRIRGNGCCASIAGRAWNCCANA